MDASLRLDDTAMADDKPESSAATSKDPLPIVLKAALAHVERATKAEKSATDHRTSAGMRFKELKDRVQAGEVGKVTWASYCAEHIPQLEQRTVERYIAIAVGEVANVGSNGSSSDDTAQSSPAEEAEMRRADFDRACEGAKACHQSDYPAGTKFDPELAYDFWRTGRNNQPDSPEARSAWNAMCDEYNKSLYVVWDGVKDANYHFWRKARGFPDDAKSRSMWDKGDMDGHREDFAGVADDKPAPSASAANKPKRDPDARRAQNAKAQANRRAKSSTIREANGGKASKPRQDRETGEQYSRLAMLAKVMDAGQLQIINEIIEERWPGTEAKAKAAKGQRESA